MLFPYFLAALKHVKFSFGEHAVQMMLTKSIKYYIAYLFHFSYNAAPFTKNPVEGRLVPTALLSVKHSQFSVSPKSFKTH